LARTQQALLEMRAKLANARQELFGASRERMSGLQLDIFDQDHEAPVRTSVSDNCPKAARGKAGSELLFSAWREARRSVSVR
uniref:hypothetical protein n=1 Tax=Caballeronia sp. GACF5 TaxID=2921746 RepID=UPI0020295397